MGKLRMLPFRVHRIDQHLDNEPHSDNFPSLLCYNDPHMLNTRHLEIARAESSPIGTLIQTSWYSYVVALPVPTAYSPFPRYRSSQVHHHTIDPSKVLVTSNAPSTHSAMLIFPVKPSRCPCPFSYIFKWFYTLSGQESVQSPR